MELNEFSSDNEIETRIQFSANISYAFYTASRDLEVFKVCFENFIKELKLLYDSKIIIAQFVPLERQIEIYFKHLDFGHILVTIKLNHLVIDYNTSISSLIVQYEIDQSFIPDLITDIEIALKRNT